MGSKGGLWKNIRCQTGPLWVFIHYQKLHQDTNRCKNISFTYVYMNEVWKGCFKRYSIYTNTKYILLTFKIEFVGKARVLFSSYLGAISKQLHLLPQIRNHFDHDGRQTIHETAISFAWDHSLTSSLNQSNLLPSSK